MYLEFVTVLAECNVPYDRLKTICAQLTKITNEFRRCITEVKESHVRQIERLQRERDAALMAARVHADVDDPNSHHHMPGVEIPTTKKVLAHTNDHKSKWQNSIFVPQMIKSICFNFVISAPTVIARQWPNVHCAGGRHTAPHFANEKIGMPTKWNAQGTKIRTRQHNK